MMVSNSNSSSSAIAAYQPEEVQQSVHFTTQGSITRQQASVQYAMNFETAVKAPYSINGKSRVISTRQQLHVDRAALN